MGGGAGGGASLVVWIGIAVWIGVVSSVWAFLGFSRAFRNCSRFCVGLM